MISITISASDDHWNILNFIQPNKKKDTSSFNLKNYCESWRINVELHNIRDFDTVPGECVDFIVKYMTSSQYNADVQRAAEESSLFLTKTFNLNSDGFDAWVFDLDDTLLSTIPYFKKHQFEGSVRMNKSSLERWMEEGRAPAVDHMVGLYNEIKGRGLKIFIVSSRGEHLRDATVNNLIKVGYHGWTQLILRCGDDEKREVEDYKAEQRKKLVKQGYRLWGNVGDQWSSIAGHPHAKRSFKLPNPMYYI
ncbi:hypothetical protein J5N97_023451 [Dioscorea zingiberensis]|uniref:Acid phosphatase 1 n=1 Tax=Dioscorea zingiberensis TaxID=325984 RepID=A0A9D5C589_9LILI|nr:hypothetical protein J5N97_023451 [Dioscorea zingiberensis]